MTWMFASELFHGEPTLKSPQISCTLVLKGDPMKILREIQYFIPYYMYFQHKMEYVEESMGIL